MKKPGPTKQDFIDLQAKMLGASPEWLSPHASERTNLCAFVAKERPKMAGKPPGAVVLAGAKIMTNDPPIYFHCRMEFADAAGNGHVVDFPAFWNPDDCLQLYQQCYMRLNELIGKDAWTGLAPVKKAHFMRVYDGRLGSSYEKSILED